MSRNCDVAIIGAGSGGYVAAIRAAQLGLSVALVEKGKTLGGTCLNVGCIPSKSLLESSELYASARGKLAEHGITAEKVSLDLKAMMRRREQVVSKLTGGLAYIMKARGVEVVRGIGRLAAPGRVVVTPEDGAEIELTSRSVILATGSGPAALPFLPFDGKRIVDSTAAIALSRVPRRLVVIGAGAIGLEMGSVWSRLGSEVTVIEITEGLLPGWDRELADGLRRELTKQGIRFELSTRVTGHQAGARSVKLQAEKPGGEAVEYAGDVVLVAVGRKPYSEGVGVEELGIEKDGPAIRVDERFQTGIPDVYAIGDVIRGPMLAHKAEEEGAAVAEILAGRPGHVDYEIIPNVVYTWPEAASVGKTERQLEEEGIPHRSGSFPFKANGRALAMGETAGWAKVLAHEKTDRILGVHILGPQASTLIAEAVTAMAYGASAEDVARTVHAHPTLAEAVREAALDVDGRPIHRL